MLNVTSADSQTLPENQDDLSSRAPSNGFPSSLPVRKRPRQRGDTAADVDTRVEHVISGNILPETAQSRGKREDFLFLCVCVCVCMCVELHSPLGEAPRPASTSRPDGMDRLCPRRCVVFEPIPSRARACTCSLMRNSSRCSVAGAVLAESWVATCRRTRQSRQHAYLHGLTTVSSKCLRMRWTDSGGGHSYATP